MGNPRGFLEVARKEAGYRHQKERIKDFNEVEKRLSWDDIKLQSSRCMDCGIPFCHGCGCPLANIIPEWNDLLCNGHWKEALELLHSTNNFPEFTGRICPAPCEAACTVGLNGEPVSIRQIELELVEKGFETGLIKPNPPKERTGKLVAIIGSGPAGLALADILNKNGHLVTVFEKNAKPGGLLRYGIPDFKLDKSIIDRRINLLKEEGIRFKNSVLVGKDVSGGYILKKYDAVAITTGAETPRDLPIPGRDLKGIHFAMDFLAQQNRINAKEKLKIKKISAQGKNVVVIGGGDTGSDCVGTSIRQGADSVTQIEIMPEPPAIRSESTPWPEWPYQVRTSSSHKEGCERLWGVKSVEFSGKNGKVKSLKTLRVEWELDEKGKPVAMSDIPDSEKEIPADLVLLAMGFTGIIREGLAKALKLKIDKRGNVQVNSKGMTSRKGVFAAGDAASGASLVVRGISTGRELAASINSFLK